MQQNGDLPGLRSSSRSQGRSGSKGSIPEDTYTVRTASWQRSGHWEAEIPALGNPGLLLPLRQVMSHPFFTKTQVKVLMRKSSPLPTGGAQGILCLRQQQKSGNGHPLALVGLLHKQKHNSSVRVLGDH